MQGGEGRIVMVVGGVCFSVATRSCTTLGRFGVTRRVGLDGGVSSTSLLGMVFLLIDLCITNGVTL